ncbi:MAG: hypothetical protein BroJett040_04060 [Oligoflexia bacterium]|nr:MAG: hypothetical protein BroJett040_04060 [Oligoflexia bacterium]
MWAIRIMNGPQAGQIFTLKEGKNKIGRAQGCDYVLNSNGVSKEHLEITVTGDRVVVSDLNSSNGTFLNGVRVKGGQLKLGDKVGAHNILFDLIVATDKLQSMAVARMGQVPAIPNGIPSGIPISPPVPYGQPAYQPQYGQQAYAAYPQGHQPGPAPAAPKQGFDLNALVQRFNDYIQRVVMPGLYSMTEKFEFKYIMMSFVGIYVVLVTLLSMIPMSQITSESITYESKRRALTVARALAQANERVLRAGDISTFSTDLVLKEEGIDDVYITSKDGRIIAPPERIGTAPKEASFIKKVKGSMKETSDEFFGKIGAAVPILSYDPDLQQNVAKAYAVVIYNPGSMKYDDGRALSLFVQMLALAFLAGGVLFFFMYKLVEYPYQQLGLELESALREGREHAVINVQLPVLQSMVTNLNSLLTRALTGPQETGPVAGAGSKNTEYINILSLVGYPGLLINNEGRIMKANGPFEVLTGMAANNIENQNINMLPDQALQKNIAELMQNAGANTGAIAMDKLDIGGHQFKLSCQAMTTASGEVDCYVLTISPADGVEGQAA